MVKPIKAGTVFDGRSTGVLRLDGSSAITLDSDAVIGAVSGISGGKITAEFSLVSGRVECKLRKLSRDEYFRLGSHSPVSRSGGRILKRDM